MTTNNINSSTSLQQSLRILLAEQKQMATLQEQLSSQKKTSDLSELGGTQSRRLLDLRSEQSSRENYVQTINTVLPRLGIQDAALDSMGDMVSNTLTYISSAQNFDQANSQNLSSQISGYLDQITGYLNEKVDGRYLYAGSRYGTQPVTDLKGLLTTDNPPSEPYPYTPAVNPDLATYDTEAVAGTPTDAMAYDKSAATIDDNITNTYGISSNDPAFQNLILGLRWAYAATQDATNYNTYMDRATTLLQAAQPALTTLQTQNAINTKQLNDTKTAHTTTLTTLMNGQDDIQKADTNAVAAQITALESQIEASYTVTAKISNLSLANYI